MKPRTTQKSKIVFLFAVCVALCVLFATPLVSAEIIIDKNTVAVGESVYIRIIPALPDQTLVIITPQTTYRYLGGVPETTRFYADVPGTYLVRVLGSNELVDSASFAVLDSSGTPTTQNQTPSATQLVVSRTRIAIGEPLLIDAPILNVQSIAISGPNGLDIRHFDSTRPVTFLPPQIGQYEVSVRYANGSIQSKDVTVEALGTYTQDPYTQNATIVASNEPIIVPEPSQEIINDTAGAVNDQPITDPGQYPLIVKRDGAVIEQTLVERFDGETFDPGTYDFDLRPSKGLLKNISIKGYTHEGDSGEFPLRVEEFSPQAVNGNKAPGAIATFAFDPQNATFSTGKITFIAVGYALYKCKQYDYDTRTCYGTQERLMDLIPGQEYTILVTPEDPLFSQSGYLTNDVFTTDTTSWIQNTESGTPAYAWTSSDTPQNGVAEMSLSGSNKNGVGNYYQPFNLTIPTGTAIISVNFSAKWRVSTYSLTGAAHFWVDDVARAVRLCSANVSFSGTTTWRQENLSTGLNGCLLSNFTINTNYTVRLRCTLATTSGGGQTEVCRWDDVNVTVFYNDTQAPVLRNISDTPDPVSRGGTINISVNVTDNIAVNTVLVEIQGTNRTMTLGNGNIYYYDQFVTTIAPAVYSYKIFANDTNNNKILNATTPLNFTILDATAPVVVIISPPDPHTTPNASFQAYYNVTDNVGVQNCSLRIDGVLVNTTTSPTQSTTLNLTGALTSDDLHLWNITCADTSGNTSTTVVRNIYRDTLAPVVLLNTTNNSIISSSSVQLNYTPQDPNLANCTLWGNFTGSWAINQTNTTPANYSMNAFPITLSDGTYGWNVQCADGVANTRFNSTNRTILVDTTPPQWANITITPANTSAYVAGATYRFNITITDAVSGVAVVVLETNITGSLVNTTPALVAGRYTAAFTDLAAGHYAYRWYMNDTMGNQNTTLQFLYVVSKATPVLNLTVNGTYANTSVGINDSVNVTGTLLTPSTGVIELYQDGTLINFGANRIENVTNLSIEKRYNFTVSYAETQNYSAAQLSLFVDVLDTTPPKIVLDSPVNGSIVQGTVNFYFTPYDNVDIENCTIVLDGVLNTTKDVSKDVQTNISVAGITDGQHNWTVNCSDLQNNTAINTTIRYFTADTQPPTAFNLWRPLSENISVNLTPVFVWNQTTDIAFDNYTIQVDNDVGFGSVNFQATTTPITNVSYQFALTDQVVWYWRVIAYDGANNQRISSQTFNYTTDATVPTVTSASPANEAYLNRSTINLSYTINEFTNITNCSLYINGTLNQTNTTVNKSATNQFVVSFAQRRYTWSVQCYDQANNLGSSQVRNLTIDTTVPTAFILSGPVNNSVISNNTPVYAWAQTTELNFDHYTVEVSDNDSFPYTNYTFDVSPITNLSVQQTPALSDGTWYWRVIAKDLANNQLIVHPQFDVDTTPPSVFELLTPPTGTEARNTTPTFTWEQSNDAHFKNYTLFVSDSPTFAWVNYTNFTLSKTSTSATLLLSQNTTFYWRVIAYDEANNSRNSTSTFTYLADFTTPNVSSMSPANNTVSTTNSLVQFQFNISDIGTISNCSLYVNNTLTQTIASPAKNTPQIISANVQNGNWTWNITCVDQSGNTGWSETRNLRLNVQVPTQVLYENSSGIGNYTVSSGIGLAYTSDSFENQVSYSVNGATLTTAVNATRTLNGSGMLIQNNTVVNFSGVFSQGNPNTFFATWKLFKVNTTATTLLCQFGDDNTGGAAVGTTTKKTLIGNCTYTGGDLRLQPLDNITLSVNMYNSAGTARTFTHFWENTSSSFTRFDAYKLGTLIVTFANLTDPTPTEDTTFVSICNITCQDGTCLGTQLYLEIWNGTGWNNVSTVGNITLNGSQSNPISLGNYNETTQQNFSLYGTLHSLNNTLRCVGVSTYSGNTSAAKNISVIDRVSPVVYLLSPVNNSAIEPQNVTFSYRPYDRHLTNCTLWGNWTGSWVANQTNATPTNDSTNSFAPVYLNYGRYLWNVQCYDAASNSAFNSTNYTLIVAGDLAIYSANITFNVSQFVEGQNITIFANVTNNANRVETGVVVQFWNGTPDTGQLIGSRTVSFGPLGQNFTNVSWVVTIGVRNITVLVDPPYGSGSVIESDETNNIANKTIMVSIWQVYYGNITGNFSLGTNNNQSFTFWTLLREGGNLYIADTDTTNGIAFAFLKAFGRNTSGDRSATTDDDFTQLDTVLNTGTYNDNINTTFTSEGNPLAVETFYSYGNTISNTPIINSSSDGNYTTGVLWDADDSANAYYDDTDREDLVFITKIRNLTTGIYGPNDFVAKLPSALGRYQGSTDTVTIYYEIN